MEKKKLNKKLINSCEMRFRETMKWNCGISMRWFNYLCDSLNK